MNTPRKLPPRPNVSAVILAGLLGDGDYMMPKEHLPIMDCDHCLYMQLQGEDELAEGCHCYMFRVKPAGDRCGQMKKEA